MSDSEIIRVFPRRTKATPIDDMAFVGGPPLWPTPNAHEVHVSVAFTWDIPEAQRIASAWGDRYHTVKIGGPALGDPGGEFTSGMYLAPGYTITSRGCPNRCGFCLVPEREGKLRTLGIKPGHDVLDNNLLACPDVHIERVLCMLARQPVRPRFTGGLEASRLGPWWAKRIGELNPEVAYVAYDHPSAETSVQRAVFRLRDAGIRQRSIGCYVLVGAQGDTIKAAEERLEWVVRIGATPFAMYFLGADTQCRKPPRAWGRLVRRWSRQAIIFHQEGPEELPLLESTT